MGQSHPFPQSGGVYEVNGRSHHGNKPQLFAVHEAGSKD